jgi:nitric oxide reductase subunit C
MLSKSQTRTFFLNGTAIFSALFLWLTVDTIRQVPERSNQKAMTAEVVRGKEIWDTNNCMGCHTLLGEGAYYAPELTTVHARRGEPWLRVFLKDPQAMFPGQRKMVQYHFTDQQISEVIAFLQWIGTINTNGFPAKPDLIITPATDPAPAAVAASVADKPAIVDSICLACHSVGGKGQKIGPAFDGVANRYTADKLEVWLKDPQAVKPGTQMPNLGLDDETRAKVITWLMTLK